MKAGNKYHCDGQIKYNYNGYHMATNFEDTIPFSDIYDSEGNKNKLHKVIIAEVIGNGDIDVVPEGFSNYFGYYGMYACSDIEIIRFIPREELISMALKLSNLRMKRFVSYCYLTEEELKLFEGLYVDVDAAIEYYHKNNKAIYYDDNFNKLLTKYHKKNK